MPCVGAIDHKQSGDEHKRATKTPTPKPTNTATAGAAYQGADCATTATHGYSDGRPRPGDCRARHR